MLCCAIQKVILPQTCGMGLGAAHQTARLEGGSVNGVTWVPAPERCTGGLRGEHMAGTGNPGTGYPVPASACCSVGNA